MANNQFDQTKCSKRCTVRRDGRKVRPDSRIVLALGRRALARHGHTSRNAGMRTGLSDSSESCCVGNVTRGTGSALTWVSSQNLRRAYSKPAWGCIALGVLAMRSAELEKSRRQVRDNDRVLLCPLCASEPLGVIVILDTSQRDRTVSLFTCQCGELIWDD